MVAIGSAICPIRAIVYDGCVAQELSKVEVERG